MNITEKSGRPVSLAPSSSEEDLMIITDKGMVIRTPLQDISVIGRDTQGVKVIKLNEGHTVSSIAVVPRQEEVVDDELDEIEETNQKIHKIDSLLENDEYDDVDENEEELENQDNE